MSRGLGDVYKRQQLERMTHMEVFSLCGKNIYVLFDYENRNPLTNQAEVTIIQWEGETK